MSKLLRHIDYTSVMHPDDKSTVDWLNSLKVPYTTNWEFLRAIARNPTEHKIKEWYDIFKAGLKYYTFQDFLKATTSKYQEAYNEVENQGEGINITSDSLPNMHNQLVEACRILNISKIPAYSTDWEYGPYHFSNGETHRRIVMMSGSADLFTNEEMQFVIAHELGHTIMHSEHLPTPDRDVEKEANELLKGKSTIKLLDKIKDGKVYVEQGVIAGCAGGTFDNIYEASTILNGSYTGSDKFTLSVYPSSTPIYEDLLEKGALTRLLKAGANIKTCFCGPCFGAGDVPANNALPS